ARGSSVRMPIRRSAGSVSKPRFLADLHERMRDPTPRTTTDLPYRPAAMGDLSSLARVPLPRHRRHPWPRRRRPPVAGRAAATDHDVARVPEAALPDHL